MAFADGNDTLRSLGMAALVGVPNEIGDDELVLAIVGDASRAAAALPGLIDAAVMPDRIVTVDALPKKGRSQKLDREALAEALEAGLLS